MSFKTAFACGICLTLAANATTAETNDPVVVSIDLSAQRFLGDESAFDRGKYINVHSDYGGSTYFKPEDAAELEAYGIGYGRFFHSPFNYFNGPPPYPSTDMVKALAPDKIGRDRNNPNFTFRTNKRIATEHPKKAFAMDRDFEESARFAADYFEYLYDHDYRPEYYEPMNEPFVHAGEFGQDQERVRRQMAEFYAAIGKEFDERDLPVKIVGYASAWPSQELWDFGHWNGRMKMFMDVAGEHIDAFSVHLYDGTNVTGQDNRRSGSNAEAILDLIETYSFIKWGHVKPHALTEYGDIPKGFGPGYSDASSSAHLNSLNHLTFGFIERQNRVLIAIPFITTKSSWYFNDPKNNFEPYGVDLWRPDPDKIVDGQVTEFIRTPKFHFYDLWKDVRGDRAPGYASDPDIYVHVFVDGAQAFVCLNNLEDQERKVQLDHLAELPAGTKTQVRRLNVPAKQPAIYTEETVQHTVVELTLEAHEAVILCYDLPQAMPRDIRVQSKTHYSKTHLQTIAADQPITFEYHGVPTGEGRASLRMSLGRKHDKSKAPAVNINGHEVAVPHDWPGYDQANREDFFGAITIPVPVEALAENTTVTLTFPDSEGRVSSLVLTTEIESSLK